MLTPAHKMKIDETVILVADDDALVREIVVEHLKSFGFVRIIEAKNGMVALKTIQDTKQRVDLVISDWEMPSMDGMSLLKAIRSNPIREKLAFVMVTSQVSRERMKISQAKQFNIDAYIVKPFRGETLKEKVFHVLGLPYEPSEKAG